MNNHLPPAKTIDLVVQELPDELLVYNVKTNKAMCLNHSSAFIWKYCDGKTTNEEALRLFEQRFNSRIDEDFIQLALDKLEEAGLIEEHTPVFRDRISRRKALLNYALPLAMLPVITSLIAPKAIYAQSAVCVTNPSQTCVTNADCDASQPSLVSVCTPTDTRSCCQRVGTGNSCCIDDADNCAYFCTNDNCCDIESSSS